uniref:Uncharacterized protein n=1 Tax=Tanacetum cinerariifolium TaxID=118510 RepID=A0A699IAF5_TANCI|nr:hypothetical protein [Tanacetum cinerariifolium]
MMRLSGGLKVIDMISDGQWKWPTEWYEKLSEITIIEVCNLDANAKDKLVWNNRNGQVKDFSVGLANHDLYVVYAAMTLKTLIICSSNASLLKIYWGKSAL